MTLVYMHNSIDRI